MPTTLLPQPSALSHLIASSPPKSPLESLPLEVLHNLRHQHNWTELRIHPQAHLTSPINTDPQEPPSFDSLPNRPPIPLPTATTTTTTSPPSHPQPTHPPPLPLLSGLPPKEIYIHPDLQAHLVLHDIHPSDVQQIQDQREFVLPLSLAQKTTLHTLSDTFDCLPLREEIIISADTNQLSAPTANPRSDTPTSESTDTSLETSPNATPVPSGCEYRHRDSKRLLLAMLSPNGTGGDGTIVYYIMQEGDVKPRQN